MFIYKGTPVPLQPLMKRRKIATCHSSQDSVVTTHGNTKSERALLSHINPQLHVVHGYFSDEHAFKSNLRGNEAARPDIYERFENIDFNSLIGLVLIFP